MLDDAMEPARHIIRLIEDYPHVLAMLALAFFLLVAMVL